MSKSSSNHPVTMKPNRLAAPLRLTRASRVGLRPSGDTDRFAGSIRTLKIPLSAKRR